MLKVKHDAHSILCLIILSCFVCSYVMSNGYKPAPLDLSDVKLNPGQEVLVDKLAENAHNVWAKDRIKQGWTYGIQQVKDEMKCMLVLKGIYDVFYVLSFSQLCQINMVKYG